MTQPIRCIIPTLSTYVTVRRLSRSDRQCWPYLHMSQCEDSVDQIYNTDAIYLCFNEKTLFIRYTIPTLSTYATMIRLSRSDIQLKPYLHKLPWEDSVDQIYNTDPIYICYHEKTQPIKYTITCPIYIYYYHEKTQSIRYTIKAISTYITMRRLSRSDIQLQALSTYITMRRLSRSDIQYRPYLHATMRRLSRSDIKYRPFLYMLPREDSVDQIYNYRPYLHILPCEDSVHQIYNTDTIYICYHGKT